MEYRRLGQSGLKVSRIGLGCMSYGDPTTTNAHTWALDDEAPAAWDDGLRAFGLLHIRPLQSTSRRNGSAPTGRAGRAERRQGEVSRTARRAGSGHR
jgi:hypothetical protein